MTPEQLKNAILQLAIQGKLVEQRKEEGTGEELYKEIQEEKKKQIKEGKLKKQKALPEITEDKIPLKIPKSWKWCYIGDIFNHISGKALNSKNTKGIKHKYITTSNVYWDSFKLDNLKEMYYTEDEIEKYSLKLNDLLVLEGGDVGRAAIWNLTETYCFQNHIHRLRPFLNVSIKYFYYNFILLKNKNIIEGKGIGIKGLSSDALHRIIVPLPPLAEQKRIVEKIEELLPLVERYEKAWTRLEELNKKFPLDMQKAILQEAIQGKLVEQRKEEGTGQELFEAIQEEKQKMVEEGKLKKQKALSQITADEIPFEIPETWKWARLGEIGFTNIGLTYKPTDISNDGTIVLRSSNIQNGKLDFSDIVRVKKDISEAKMCQVGDILICARNGSKKLVGKAALINLEGMSFGAFMAVYRSICNGYVLHFINSAYFRNALLPETGTTTINQLTQDSLKNCVIPIPPLAEQKRIVEKIEQLLPLCEKLK